MLSKHTKERADFNIYIYIKGNSVGEGMGLIQNRGHNLLQRLPFLDFNKNLIVCLNVDI